MILIYIYLLNSPFPALSQRNPWFLQLVFPPQTWSQHDSSTPVTTYSKTGGLYTNITCMNYEGNRETGFLSSSLLP